MSKVVATRAVYLELQRESETSQVLLTPQVLNPVKDSMLKPYIISRKVSEMSPRKSWRYSSGPRHPFIDKAETISHAVEIAVAHLKWVTPLLAGYVSGGWKLVNAPIAVEMTTDDLMDVAEKKTPAALLRRVTKSRLEAGYPETVIVSLPYVPTTF
jgi:hypothetical protein